MPQEPRLELHASVDALREELQEVRRQSEEALLELHAELEGTTGPIREELARLTELTRCLGRAGDLPDGPERPQWDVSSLQDAAAAPRGGPSTTESAADLCEFAETVVSIRGELAQAAEMLSGAEGLAQSVLSDVSGFREELRGLRESHLTALSAAMEQLRGHLLEEMRAMIDERQQAIVGSQPLLPTSSPVKPQALIHCFNSLTLDAADSLGRSTAEVADSPLRGEPMLETNLADGFGSNSGRRELEGLGELSGDDCASEDDNTILPWLPHGHP